MAGPLRKAIDLVRTDSFEVLRGKLGRRLKNISGRGRYCQWIRKYHTLNETDVEKIREVIASFSLRPVISVLMPVYNTEERYLRAAIDSVRAQVYENWELCIADDHSPDPHVRTILAEYAASDPRIKISIRDENGHISAASNSALDLVTGEFTALMDHDDEISPLALYFVARELDGHPDANIIYTDEDKIDERGQRYDPLFKPDWSPELLLGVNYVNHLTVYRTNLMRECGGFRSEFDGSQDYDLLLRMVERSSPATIRHIPRVLYHWRAISGSVAYASDEKPYAHDRARIAIAEHLERIGVAATITRGIGQLHRTIYKLPDVPPKVSVIVHGRRSAVDLDKLLECAGSLPVEILTSTDTGCTKRGEHTTWVSPDRQNRYDRLNLAARAATGSVLCFLSSDIRYASELWLETLAAQAIQPGVGAVGPMIYDRAKRITSAGYILSGKDSVTSAFEAQRVGPKGRSIRLDLPQNVSAVPVDCIVISAENFASIGGFDEDAFEVYGAVDLCLRLREAGLRNVWTPYASLMQSAKTPVASKTGLSHLRDRWSSYFERDPFYNPNLSPDVRKWELAFPPRLEKY